MFERCPSLTACLVVATFGMQALLYSSPAISAETAQLPFDPPIGSAAEWYKADWVLMHTPGEELLFGLLHPEAALFEDVFSIEEAGKEHRHYMAILEKQGARVVTVRDLLLRDTADPDGEGRRDLLSLAERAVTLDLSALKPEEADKQRTYFRDSLRKQSPESLVRTILLRPTIRLRVDPAAASASYNLTAIYEASPLMNLYFTRDQLITTAKGVVIGRMARPQRLYETEVLRLVLKKLGVAPLLEVQGEGRLEGGDFLPAGRRAFLGQGIRTNQQALEQLLTADAFGADEVIAVKDGWKQQQEMHLDTYFNIADEGTAVLIQDRYDCAGSPKCLTADLWRRNGTGGYEKQEEGVDFVRLLGRLGFTIIPVSVKDQALYGINFLTIGRHKIIGVDGVSAEYKDALAQAGIEATWIPFEHMKRGYGAAHCTTQVLRRAP
jgi:arginine deiminase